MRRIAAATLKEIWINLFIAPLLVFPYLVICWWPELKTYILQSL